jgi:hypothetical protein
LQLLRFSDERTSKPRHDDSGVTGDERLSANNDAENRPPPKERKDAPRKRRRGDPPGEVGKALRTVYDNTLREEVPNDFLDLLGKLS